MATKKQIQANRRNARRCTGPKTAEGKAICGMNALRHGMFAATVILPGEDKAEFDNIHGGFQDLYQPQNVAEQHMVDELAAIKWKMLRAALFEAQIVTEFEDNPLESSVRDFDRISQIHSRLLRMWFKLYRQLETIQALRRVQPPNIPRPDQTAAVSQNCHPTPAPSPLFTHNNAHSPQTKPAKIIEFPNTA